MAFYDSCLKENSNNKVGLPGVWKFQTSLSEIQQAEDDTSTISHPELPRWSDCGIIGFILDSY